MTNTLKGRSFLSLADFTPAQINQILETTRLLKQQYKMGIHEPLLKGKTIGMIFQKPSTRTRVSFEVAIYQLGGFPIYLSANELQLSRGENIADTARTLSRYVDAIVARVYAHQDVVDLARYASVPVINALSDYSHPCQGVADLFTIAEKRKTFNGLKIAYIGDGNNVAHSLIFGIAKVGGRLVVASPLGYQPNQEVVHLAQQQSQTTGAQIEITNDPVKAAQDADIIYTDVWTSMGQEHETEKRREVFKSFQINKDLVKYAKKDVMVMHCLPAHRNEEITDEVIDGPNSIIWDQAENRLHTAKALLVLLLR